MAARFTRLFSSTILPNTGSTARDHLANERTFLAWSRTGLGFVGLGIALETFGYQRSNLAGTRLDNKPQPQPQPDQAPLIDWQGSKTAAPTPVLVDQRSQTQTQLGQKRDQLPSIEAIVAHAMSSPDRLASATLIGIGGMFLAFGTARYFSTLKLLTQGKFQPNTKGVGMMVASSAVITSAGLAVVLVPEGTWIKSQLGNRP
ncbi:hypothetical protein BCR33DRAFT_724113 [Rhizoclosmatium globosum]|uniref:DUF202 domain-containing protein n=1 Tax=Rhizoclosmatium globosum TaxID=329046 RepID=A0A1Y2B9M9_9FUNG|nr:hypothetical protein BCR33DRAFT_724113 [Rhizoclosmatium globosum]|eukprot:ORY31187.1 hypothetical protein BCR33DRAFT_724113 [Rhizoclosmatium globosum]